MKIEVEESALDSISEMGKRLQQERDELLAMVGELVRLNEAQQILIGVLQDQNAQLAAQLETINAIGKAMK